MSGTKIETRGRPRLEGFTKTFVSLPEEVLDWYKAEAQHQMTSITALTRHALVEKYRQEMAKRQGEVRDVTT